MGMPGPVELIIVAALGLMCVAVPVAIVVGVILATRKRRPDE